VGKNGVSNLSVNGSINSTKDVTIGGNLIVNGSVTVHENFGYGGGTFSMANPMIQF
jgi:hypothetical protein